MNNNEMQYLYLVQQKAKLEARKKDLVNWKFMGGGFGLFIFLFISMMFGIFVWIFAAIANNNELKNISTELNSINTQISLFQSNATSTGNVSSALNKNVYR